MKPREFLRKQGYESALLLTWSFDPVFFERVFLRLLHAGGTGQVAVVMDGRQLAEFEQRLPRIVTSGMVSALGTEYALDGARSEGHFHPKLWIRCGESGALVWVGSCNLTEFGWNGQWELSTAWEIGPEHQDKGGWLRPVLEDLSRLCKREGTLHAIERMLASPWLPTEAGAEPPVLWSGRQTLALQLEERWRDLRFDTAHMLTGSTDDGAALARWVAAQFGVRRFTLALTPGRCDLDADRILDLACDLRIAPFGGALRPLHAKLLWLQSGGRHKAVMGSANFSASAWLRPISKGGNHELVAVYDEPDPDGFAELLPVDDLALDARTYLAGLPDRGPTNQEPGPSEHRFTVLEARWDSVIGEISLRLQPAPTSQAVVELLEEETIRLSPAGDYWTARVKRSPGCWCVRIRVRDEELEAGCTTFVDDQRELRATVGTRRWSAFFDAARGGSSFSEQRRMVEDFARLRATLFLPTKATSVKTGGSTGHRTSETPGSPLDPVLLAGAKVVHTGLPVTPGASLRGGIGELLRSIFNFDDHVDGVGSDTDEEGESPRRSDGSSRTAPLAHRTVERLCQEMEAFFTDLKDKELAANGSPEQLQQAFALPIALALLGLEGEWLQPAVSGDWVHRILVAMLQEKLLPTAMERFRNEEKGRDEIAMRLLGDGALLAAARVAIAVVPWSSRLRRALALRQLDDTPELRSCASLEAMERLLGCVRVTSEHRAARDAGFEDIGNLRRLEVELERCWDDLARVQEAARGEWVRLRDVVRLRSGAWGVIESEEPLLARTRPRVHVVGKGTNPVYLAYQGRTLCLDLHLLARLGAVLPPMGGLLDLSEEIPAGPRELAAVRQGLWRR